MQVPYREYLEEVKVLFLFFWITGYINKIVIKHGKKVESSHLYIETQGSVFFLFDFVDTLQLKDLIEMSYKPWKVSMKGQRTIPDNYRVDNYVQKIPTNLSLDLNNQVTTISLIFQL